MIKVTSKKFYHYNPRTILSIYFVRKYYFLANGCAWEKKNEKMEIVSYNTYLKSLMQSWEMES